MSIDPRKRQKKHERQAAKRKAKQHQLAREKHAGLAERLTAAARYPVLHCWAATDLWDQGIGWVCLSRELPTSQVAFAVFLVDRYCLGVKDIAADVVGRFTYDSQIVRKMTATFTSEHMAPAAARKLVEEAVAYARSLGLHPHPDYPKARHLFGTIDASQCTEEFEFGKDGQPLFIAGPHDGPDRCFQIIKTLEQSCGVGRFHYLIPQVEGGYFLPESVEPEELPGPGAE
jgi:hypothetical protein